MKRCGIMKNIKNGETIRKEREAKALRDNLMRRKSQMRQRDSQEEKNSFFDDSLQKRDPD